MTSAPQQSAGEPVPFHRQLISVWAGAKPEHPRIRVTSHPIGVFTQLVDILHQAGIGYGDPALSGEARAEFIQQANLLQHQIENDGSTWSPAELRALLASVGDRFARDEAIEAEAAPLADRIIAVWAGHRPAREAEPTRNRRSPSFSDAAYEIAAAGHGYGRPGISEREQASFATSAAQTAKTFKKVLKYLPPADVDAFLAEVGFYLDRPGPTPIPVAPAPQPSRSPKFLTSRETAAPLARLLIDTWAAIEPKSNIALYPVSYSESFLDLARAAADAGYGHQYPSVSEAEMSAFYAKAQRIINNLSRPDGAHNPADIVEFLTETMDIMRVRPIAVPGAEPAAADVWDRMIRSSISIDADRVKAAAFAIIDEEPELDLGIASQRARDQINPYGPAGPRRA